MLKKLNPKQKRIAIAAAIGGALGLIVLVSKRGTAATDTSSTDTSSTTDTGTSTGDPGGSFGDSGSGMGDLASAFTDAIGQQNDAIGGIASGLQTLSDQFAGLDFGSPTTAPGPAGDTGTPQAVTPQQQTARTAARSPAATTTRTIIKPSAKHGGAPSVYHETVDASGKRVGQPTYVRPATHAVGAPKAAAAPAFRTEAGHDSKGHAGVWHIYPNRPKVFVRK